MYPANVRAREQTMDVELVPSVRSGTARGAGEASEDHSDGGREVQWVGLWWGGRGAVSVLETNECGSIASEHCK